MSQFIQLHLLTSYPPSNLNRDDLGRPKTAKMGGFERLRVSSQSLKRAWRTSDLFVSHWSEESDEILGKRTKRIGLKWIYQGLVEHGVDEELSRKWSREIIRAYGAPEGDKDDGTDKALLSGQLVFISYAEQLKLKSFVKDLALWLKNGISNDTVLEVDSLIKKRDKSKDKKGSNATLARALADILLVKNTTAIDIALFGRMLASVPSFGFEAACQVAHAISVHSVVVEDDYFTAVDDLNDGSEDAGSAHIGETGFAAALFYSYICINKSLLIENLDGNEELANQAIRALTEAATKISPSGKQNSYASRAYASFVLAEKGEQQPRSLSVAFLKPVMAEDQADEAVKALVQQIENFDKVYGDCADSRYQVNALTGEGSFAELLDFVAK